MSATTVLFVGSKRWAAPVVGAEITLDIDYPLPPGTAMVGDLAEGLGNGSWPPDVVEMVVEERAGKRVARATRVPTGTELYGPRADQIATLLERIETAPWYAGPTGAALVEAAEPFVAEFARAVARSGPCLQPKVHLLPTMIDARNEIMAQKRVATVGKAIVADVDARRKSLGRESTTRARGAIALAIAGSCKIVKAHAAPLFRAALDDFATPPGVRALREALGPAVLPVLHVSEWPAVVHELEPLASAIPKMIVASLMGNRELSHGLSIPGASIIAQLVEHVHQTFLVGANAGPERLFASLACRVAWQPVSCIVEGMVAALSQHLINLALRPAGSFDLWKPWVDLFQLGAPVVGFTTPSRFVLVQRG